MKEFTTASLFVHQVETFLSASPPIVDPFPWENPWDEPQRLQRDLAASVQEVRDLLEVRGGAAAGGHGLRTAGCGIGVRRKFCVGPQEMVKSETPGTICDKYM